MARKLDKLVDLVEIVLRFDQVRGWRGVFLRHEVQDRDEGDARGEEGDEPDAKELMYGDVEDQILGVVCDAVHAELNLRTHDLVPAIDAPYQPPAALEAARAAEWMREGGRRREVRFEGFALGGGWGLG